MSAKPLKIEKVEGCWDCPFSYLDNWGTQCAQNGTPALRWEETTQEHRYDYPPDCPLITSNICVELES